MSDTGDVGPGAADAGSGDSGTSDSYVTGTGDGEQPDPRELLGEVRAIRRRTRLARHAYWFPLVMFGLLVAASVPFYIQRFQGGPGWYAVSGPFALRSGYLGGFGLLTASGLPYYWLGAMVLGIAATVFWYRWHGNRIGLRTPARGYLITGTILVALALLIPVIAERFPQAGHSYVLPLIMPGELLVRGTFPFVLIGLGLCVLAWAERSIALAVIASGYLALSVVASLYDIENVFYYLGWSLSPATSGLPNVVLPALVLLLSGAGAWAVQRRHRRPAEPATEG